MKSLIAILLMCLSFSAIAQDKIYFADGKMEEGKVLEIERSFIIIQNAENVKLKVPREEISLIVYQNGKSEIYNKNYHQRTGDHKVEKDKVNKIAVSTNKSIFRPNQLKLNMVALVHGGVELAYQRKLFDFFAVEFPLSYGWEAGESPYKVRKKYSVGVNFLFYTLNPESIAQFYIGPGLETGNAYFDEDVITEFGNLVPGQYVSQTTSQFSNYLNVSVRLGLTFNVFESVSIGMEVAPGMRQVIQTTNFTVPSIAYNFNLLYHF